MGQGILAIGGTIVKTTNVIEQIAANARQAKFEGGFLSIFIASFVHFFFAFGRHFFDASRLNTTIFDEDLKSLAGDFATNRIEARDRDDFWGIVND